MESIPSTITTTGQTKQSWRGQPGSAEFGNNKVVCKAAGHDHQPAAAQLTLQTANAVLPSRHPASPLSTAPYHTEALFPMVTSPITEALGATKVCSPSVGRLPAKA